MVFSFCSSNFHSTLVGSCKCEKNNGFKISFMFIFQLIAMKSIANASHNRSLSEFQQVVLCIKNSYCRCNYANVSMQSSN